MLTWQNNLVWLMLFLYPIQIYSLISDQVLNVDGVATVTLILMLSAIAEATTLDERIQMVKKYSAILLIYCHDETQLSKSILEVEKSAS